jgi:hypothetical protein
MRMLWSRSIVFWRHASFAGALVAALHVPACCKDKQSKVEHGKNERAADDITNCRLTGRTFRLEFPITEEQRRDVAGRPAGKVRQSVVFAEPVCFPRVGETIEAFGYQTLTLAGLGEAQTGKYAMRATLRTSPAAEKSESPARYAVTVENVRLVEKLVAPAALPDKRAILPGQVVVRAIREGEIQRVDDSYHVELPGKANVSISITPPPEQYGFRLIVSRGGAPLPLRRAGGAHRLETVTSGVHELRVLPAEGPVSREPASYRLYVVWGDASIEGDLNGADVQWRDVRVLPGAGER